MWVPLAILAVLSLVGGAILAGLQPLASLFGVHSKHIFEAWNEPSVAPKTFSAEIFHTQVSTEAMLVIASIAAAVIGIALMATKYRKGMPKAEVEFMNPLQRAAGEQWFYDRAMYKTFVDAGGRFAQGFYRWFDKGIVDGIFVNGSAKVVGAFGLLFRKTQTGYVRYYAMAMVIGAIAIMSYVIWATTKIGVVR
jgi:NADH-quinone oxidoreductase subunit L